MISLLLLIGAFSAACVAGVLLALLLVWAGIPERPAVAIGTGVWILSFPCINAYASLWLYPRQAFTSRRGEGKLRTAELRCGFFFAAMSSLCASSAGAPPVVIGMIAIACAVLGALIGRDLKRRVQRARAA